MILTRDFVLQGIFVDAEGNICEGANMNVAILTQQGELLVRVPRLSFMQFIAACFTTLFHCA